MANTSLRTNITAGATGNIADRNTVHAEVNELSRDTGWRDVTGLLINGWTAGSYVHIRRIRDRVYLRFKGLNGTAQTSTRLMDFTGGVGTGFSPADLMESSVYRNSSDVWNLRLTASLSGGITSVAAANFGTTSCREWDYPCSASWPSSLPGTAVS